MSENHGFDSLWIGSYSWCLYFNITSVGDIIMNRKKIFAHDFKEYDTYIYMSSNNKNSKSSTVVNTVKGKYRD